MLLLYPHRTLQARERSCIYIPLCFYFIPRAYEDSAESKLIYIPLCFYFIKKGYNGRFAFYIFTFHYASTLSREVHMELTRRDGFTFHYASTLSDFKRLLRIIATYLHSTMLLLYRIWKNKKRSRKLIYIPLCFYFIRDLYNPVLLFSLIYIPLCFYFIRSPMPRRPTLLYLHSTMLLLYPIRHFLFRTFL